jgi:hypothetical protein
MHNHKAPLAWSCHQGATLFDALTVFGKINREQKLRASASEDVPPSNQKDAFELARIVAVTGCILIGFSVISLI